MTRESPDAPSLLLEPARPIELYELVGRGRVHVLSASYSQLPQAVDAFRAAIALDSTYAPAHAGLARVRCAQAVLRAVPHRDAFAEAKASALRALSLDSGSADAQVALGTVQFLVDWDWSAAERSLRRALRISPDHTEALVQYGSLLEALGQLDEGLRLKQRALARDPRSPLVLVHIALSHSFQRRYDEALLWAHRALEIDPTHLLGTFRRVRLLAVGGHRTLHRPEHPYRNGARRRECADGGPDAVRGPVSAGVRREGTRRAEPVHRQSDASSRCRRRIGDGSAAGRLVPGRRVSWTMRSCAWRYEAIAVRDPGMVYLAVNPMWDPLRCDPRFADRLRAVSLRGLDS